MSIRRYQNEVIVGVAFIFMLFAFLYKQGQVNAQEDQTREIQSTLNEIREVVELKEVWASNNLSKKVNGLKTVASEQKVQWNQKSTKLTASYKGLTVNELNKLVKVLLNLGIEINVLEVKRDNAFYDVELKCKW